MSGIYYHVTPTSKVEKILNQGLVPTIGNNSSKIGLLIPRIYLFDNLDSLHDAASN